MVSYEVQQRTLKNSAFCDLISEEMAHHLLLGAGRWKTVRWRQAGRPISPKVPYYGSWRVIQSRCTQEVTPDLELGYKSQGYSQIGPGIL